MTSDRFTRPREEAARLGLTYYVGADHERGQRPAWALWRRANIGTACEFAERSYIVEQVGSDRSPRWARRAFTSGGWWSTDAVHETSAEALADLTALCERLNQPF